jgi:hypothetical protein
VARKDLGKLQTLRENLWQLKQNGLTRIHLIRMFFSCRIQPLRRRRTKMWTYPRQSCPDRPPSKELSAAEVETQIHKFLDLGVIPSPDAGHVPLWRGIASVRVSTLGPVSVAFAILSLH